MSKGRKGEGREGEERKGEKLWTGEEEVKVKGKAKREVQRFENNILPEKQDEGRRVKRRECQSLLMKLLFSGKKGEGRAEKRVGKRVEEKRPKEGSWKREGPTVGRRKRDTGKKNLSHRQKVFFLPGKKYETSFIRSFNPLILLQCLSLGLFPLCLPLSPSSSPLSLYSFPLVFPFSLSFLWLKSEWYAVRKERVIPLVALAFLPIWTKFCLERVPLLILSTPFSCSRILSLVCSFSSFLGLNDDQRKTEKEANTKRVAEKREKKTSLRINDNSREMKDMERQEKER